MKKLAMAAIVIVLFMIPAVYAQTVPRVPRRVIVLIPQGNNLRIQASAAFSGGPPLVVDFKGKINGKPIEFEDNYVMNDGGLSDAEHRLVEIGLDLITSGFNRGKFEMPEMSFELKAEEGGDALLAVVKSRSGGSVFEGKLEGGVSGKRFEFKQDAAGTIIVNNGTLSEDEVWVIEWATNLTKLLLGQARGKQ